MPPQSSWESATERTLCGGNVANDVPNLLLQKMGVKKPTVVGFDGIHSACQARKFSRLYYLTKKAPRKVRGRISTDSDGADHLCWFWVRLTGFGPEQALPCPMNGSKRV